MTRIGKAGRHCFSIRKCMSHEGVTIGGMLLFGLNPKRFLPQSGIEAVAHIGTEKDYNARERINIRERYDAFRKTDSALWKPGWLNRQSSLSAAIHPVETILADGARRERRRTYPDKGCPGSPCQCACSHRDYLLFGTDIELSLYEDRLRRVISPQDAFRMASRLPAWRPAAVFREINF